MSIDTSSYNFLPEGGDMGKLIRLHDWNATPLGHPASWPQPLKTLVGVMLDNPFATCIAWGKVYTQIYNDGYRTILGNAKHPQALGIGSQETFSEVWDKISAMFDEAMEGNAVRTPDLMLPLERSGATENCYFDFSCSPIRLEGDHVGGVLITVVETTKSSKVVDGLKESEERFRTMAEGTDTFIAVDDESGNATYFSSAWAKMTGRTIDELLKFGWLDLLHPEDREPYISSYSKAFEKRKTFTGEFRILNSEGEYKWLLAQAPPRLRPDGSFGGYIRSCVDITEQKTYEIELEQSKDQLEFAIDAAELGTWDYNPLTDTFSANERLKRWFGLPDIAEIELRDALNAVAEEDKERVKTAIQDSFEYASGGMYDIEFSIINLTNSKERIVHAKGRVWFNEEKVAYRLNGTLADVTTRVLAREEVAKSELRYHNLIQSSPSSIAILTGSNFLITIANDSIMEYWGKGTDIIGKPFFEVLPEMIDQGYVAILTGVYETGVPFTAIETPIQTVENGVMNLKYYNFIIYPQKDLNGTIDSIGIISSEVTSQAIVNNKVKESEQSIRALVESAPFPIAVYVGEEMRIALANQAIMDAWGKGNDVIGKLYTEVLPELENQQIFEKVRKVLNTGIPFHAKNQKVDLKVDNQLKSYYFNYSFSPVLNNSGEVYAVMNTAAEVTELNEANLKVEESERRFRESVKQAPLGITIFRGPENRIEMANENYLVLVDKTESDFVGHPLFETLPETEASMAPIIAEIYRTGEAYFGYEVPVKSIRKGKLEITYFNFVYHPLKEDNSISGIMVVANEITETVKAKHNIEENEQKLTIIIDGSELGVFDINLKTGEAIASERYYEILGFSEERKLSHKELIVHLHPDDMDIRNAAFETAFKTGILHYKSRLLWKDHSVHWMDAKGKVFFDDNKEPERVIGTVRDITEERTFNQRLLEREEKFRLLADSMPQFVWTADTEGNLNYFNQSVFDYSGLTPEQMYEEGWLQIVHPKDREENLKQWSESITTGKDFLIEHRFRNSNGDYRWQLSRAIPQRDSSGKIRMWVGTSTDIQEQKMFTSELEHMVLERTNELQQNNVDLEKMNKELQSFVYISSHDLQEPLRKIQMFASRILETEYETLSETAENYFSRMQKAAFRMQTLIQDLLAYSRTDVKENNYEIAELCDIIDDVKETLSEELEQNNVTFKLDLKCKVKIIPIQFRQIIHNLISNSMKFAKEEQPICIEIECDEIIGKETGIETLKADQNYCHIRFADNGIGFEQEYSERIFEVFQRLHNNETYTGTGIGLAIVKKIIENHNGIIFAEGVANQGATFHIYLLA